MLGRETLLKSVIRAIPTYSMSCCFLKKGVYNFYLEYGKFLMGESLDRRSLHWLAWDKLATPKAKGRMRFCDFHLFNLALIGKHRWRFMMNPNSLCASYER